MSVSYFRRALFSLQGPALDHGGELALCYCRGRIEAQKAYDGNYTFTLRVGGSDHFECRATGDCAKVFASKPAGTIVSFLGKLRLYEWRTQIDGARERVVVEISKVVEDEDASGDR